MNYFGHAALAIRRLASSSNQDVPSPSRFVLGAMAPDLLAMMRHPLPRLIDDRSLAAGVEFHVEVDAAFHQTEAFVRWNKRALLALKALGVRRGPARACAHIGVEMLIDAELIRDRRLFTGYEAALREGKDGSDELFPTSLGMARDFAALCEHLLEGGESIHTTTAPRLELRLGRTLAGRARLEPSSRELTTVADYLCGFPSIAEELPLLLQQLAPLFEGAPATTSSNPREPVVS